MSDAGVIKEWMAHTRGEFVDIVLAGRAFGGRHGESPQELESYKLWHRRLIMRFGTTETLVVEGADSIRIGERGELIVPVAKRVAWGWHYYGRPQTPENWCTETYVLEEDGVVSLSVQGPMTEFVPSEEHFEYDGGEFVRIEPNTAFALASLQACRSSA